MVRHKNRVTIWFAPAFTISTDFTSILVLHAEVFALLCFALLQKLKARTHYSFAQKYSSDMG